jgi:hypothetical protein
MNTQSFNKRWIVNIFCAALKLEVEMWIRGRCFVWREINRFTLRLAVYSQPVRLGFKTLETQDQYFFSTEQLQLESVCNICLTRRWGLMFTISAGPRQRSHSRVTVSRGSWPHFTVWDSRVPQPGGPGPCTYILQENGDPVTPPGTGFTFRRLLRLAGPRWSYWTPPLRGFYLVWRTYVVHIHDSKR